MHLSIEHHGFNDKLLMYKCNRRSRCICLKLLHHNTTIQPPFNCVFDEHKYNDKILRSFWSFEISTFIQNQLQQKPHHHPKDHAAGHPYTPHPHHHYHHVRFYCCVLPTTRPSFPSSTPRPSPPSPVHPPPTTKYSQ